MEGQSPDTVVTIHGHMVQVAARPCSTGDIATTNHNTKS